MTEANEQRAVSFTIDGRSVSVPAGSTILQAAERLGIEIPTLCFVEGLPAMNSCMVCLVKIVETGKFVPACSTAAEDGMAVESETGEVAELRREALELLVGDHRGDCEAPCRLVHPRWLDVPLMIHRIAAGDYAGAAAIAAEHEPAAGDRTPPYEKACRRGRIDEPVAIERLIDFARSQKPDDSPVDLPASRPWTVTMGALQDEEKELYAQGARAGGPVVPASGGRYSPDEARAEAARCLHCDCRGRDECRLLYWAVRCGADPKRRRRRDRVYRRDDSHPLLLFEPGKCIRCGLCVHIAAAAGCAPGMAHLGRGFDGSVEPPFGAALADALDDATARRCAAACPTATLTLKPDFI